MRNGFIQKSLSENDVLFILGMAEAYPETEQILVTGEIAMDRLSEEGQIAMLYGWNKTLEDNLILLTDRQTAMMTRYEPQMMWHNMPPKRRAELFEAERRRFGVERWSSQWPTFYEGVFKANDMFGKYVILDNLHDTAYINAVLLLHKANAYGIRMSQFFSTFSFANVELRSLSKEKEARLHEVRAESAELPTLDEMLFLTDLFVEEKTDRNIIHFPHNISSFPYKKKMGVS